MDGSLGPAGDRRVGDRPPRVREHVRGDRVAAVSGVGIGGGCGCLVRDGRVAGHFRGLDDDTGGGPYVLASRVPRWHVTVVVVCEHEPCVAEAERNVVPSGRVSVTMTFVASAVPLSYTSIVYVIGLDSCTESGPDLDSARLAVFCLMKKSACTLWSPLGIPRHMPCCRSSCASRFGPPSGRGSHPGQAATRRSRPGRRVVVTSMASQLLSPFSSRHTVTPGVPTSSPLNSPFPSRRSRRCHRYRRRFRHILVRARVAGPILGPRASAGPG